MTPREIWLSPEAVVLMVLAACLLTAGVLYVHAHRPIARRIAIATVVTAVLAETALRLVNHVRPSFIFYSDSYSRYRGHPGARHFDSQLNSGGFNDVEHQLSKSPDLIYRITAIGDSFAFGVVPYRANYLTLLETEISARGPIEVINMGVSATEPRDYLAILVKEALAFEPDLVMVGFFIGNDFEETEKRAFESSDLAAFFHFLWRLWQAGPQTVLELDSSTAGYHDDQPSLPPEQFLEIAIDRAAMYSAGESGLKAAAIRAVGYLRQMREIARHAGADLLAVLIPDQVQIDSALRQEVARSRGVTSDRLDVRLPNRLMADELSRHGIRYFDLLPGFEQEGRRARLYKPNDTHWNLAGNRLAASLIAQFLREQMLPRRRSDRD